MMYVLNSPSFQYFFNFISIYGQNSVKILTNPYTWRHCQWHRWLHYAGPRMTVINRFHCMRLSVLHRKFIHASNSPQRALDKIIISEDTVWNGIHC